jgi:wyosine [tRNA(Phe)-imidazoG37] synthetase (radical SAM superfamily)
LGRTRPLTNDRRSFISSVDILAELRDALATPAASSLDYVTFVGSGETTLHADIGLLIRRVRDLASVPVAVITNGSLLHLPDVRTALAAADAVLPSLDAGSASLFRLINRPHSESTFERLIEGLTVFSREYQGKLWVEIMLVEGLNDSQEALQDLADVLQKVQPDQIHLMRPTRPPAEAWVEPADDAATSRALAVLGRVAPVLLPEAVDFQIAGDGAFVETILAALARHPAREKELKQWLKRCLPQRGEALFETMKTGGQIQIVERYGTRFWSVPEAYYAARTADPSQ